MFFNGENITQTGYEPLRMTPLCVCVDDLAITFGRPTIMGGRDTGRDLIARYVVRECNVTVGLAGSPIIVLAFHSAFVGGIKAERFRDFLTQARLNLNPDKTVILIYNGATAHNNPRNPGANTELKKLSRCSPFLNIVEQAVSALKAAMKTDISRPDVQARMNNRDEARDRGLPLGEYRTQLLLEAHVRYIGTITAAKSAQWYPFMQTFLPRCFNGEGIAG